MVLITALALSDVDELEGKGVYVNYEFTQNNMLVTVYIGLYGIGIIACYYATSDEWHSCQSHGNYGKNCASGGNWSVTNKSTNPPECIKNLIMWTMYCIARYTDKGACSGQQRGL